MRLLLVEDNEELARLLAQRLQTAGYETDLLTTAAEALAAVTTTRYAAMVLDLGLPDGDGLSVLREIRRGEDPLPVLVLTARGGLQDRVSGLRSGADDSSNRLRSKSCWPAWKRCCGAPANCSAARFKLRTSRSTPRADRHSSTANRKCYRLARPRCSNY